MLFVVGTPGGCGAGLRAASSAEEVSAPDPASARAISLTNARLLWQRAGIRDYDFEYGTGGFAASIQVRIAVRNGFVASVESLVPAQGTGAPETYPTVDTLFEKVAQAADLHEVTFDPHLGFPTHALFGHGGEIWDFAIRTLSPR